MGPEHGAMGCTVRLTMACPANISALLGVNSGVRLEVGLSKVPPFVEVHS